MKKIFLGFLPLMFFNVCNGQLKVFEKYKGWEHTLNESNKKNKQVLFYFEATWCTPCQQLLNGVFADPAVKQYLEKNFISYNFDADDKKSIPLLEKYRIISYPRIIVLNQSGYLKGGIENIAQTTREFINQVDDLAKSITIVKSVSNKLQLNYPSFYNAYFNSRLKKMPDSAIVTNYLRKQNDLFSETNWNILSLFNYDTKYLDFIIENKSKYQRFYGNAVAFRIYEITRELSNKYIQEKDSVQYNRLFKKIIANPNDSNYFASLASYAMKEIFFLAKTGMDWPKFISRAESYIAKYGDKNNHFICNYVYYSDCKEDSVFKFLLKIMPSVIEHMPYADSYLMYGCFLFRTGNKQDADINFQKALSLSKSGEEKENCERKIADIKRTE